jgi:DNA-binding MarR family transcriptional regulator
MASVMEEALNELGRVVQGYQSAVDDADREAARILGVNRTDMRCLELLLSSAELSPRELGQRLGLTTGSVTAMLDRLERLDFLARNPHPDDRRKSVVTITAEGARRCYELFAPLIAEGNHVLAKEFEVDQLRLGMQFLRTLTEVQNRHVDRLLVRTR